MIRRCVFLFFGLMLLSAPPTVFAENAKVKLHHIESTLSQRQAEAEELARKEREQSSGLGELRQKLIAAGEALAEKQDDQNRLEDKQAQLADDIAAKSAALGKERHNLAALVTALIEIGRRPPESLVLQSGPTVDHIHRTIYLRAILPRAREAAEGAAHDLDELNELKSRMAQQQKLTAAAGKNLQEQRANLDQLIKARQGLLQKTEAQKAAIQTQLVSLSTEARDLCQLLEKVTPPHASKAAPDQGPGPSLRWPVAGRQTRHFGDRDRDGVRSEGITFAALPGAPVVAPAAGRVVFAGPFKGYGPIVILQHKNGYHSFLAGFGRIDADMGDDLDAGEPLGVMPAGGKPELYFEWRRNNEPVNPAG